MVDKFRIRLLDSIEDFEKLVDIQRMVWKHEDLDVTPVHQFCVSAKMGGIILGARVGRELGGYAYSFPALINGKPCQHSHHLAVLPEFRGLGLGKSLKWAQREESLKRGFRLVTWTFDPLQARNANLNLQALGAVSRTYIPNFYGVTPSLCLGPGIPTDRLLVEWPIGRKRVKEKLNGEAPKLMGDAEDLPKALERRRNDPALFAAPSHPKGSLMDRAVLVEVPPDIEALRRRPDLIGLWQKELRRIMTRYFERGYQAEHFLHGDRCFYVLMKRGPSKSVDA